MIKGRKRHLAVWKTLQPLAKPWIVHKFNLDVEELPQGGPYLVLANHNTDWDPLMMAMAVPQQIYFVASEHIFRWGLISKIITSLVDPISRLKGRNAASTVMTVMRRLRDGANVCIFAEGDKSWDGVTCPVLEATGKMARSCGATLITYRFEGGYLTHPRWAKTGRRGAVRGRIVGMYPPEELKKMKPEQVNALIARDLYEDAYARQEQQPVIYRGKRLAEGLETALCFCPECGGLETMNSKNDRFYCTECGFETRYTQEGYFTQGRFKTVRQWSLWQQEQIENRVRNGEGEYLFLDEDVELMVFDEGHKTRHLGTGTLCLTRDALTCAGMTVPISDISGMALHGRQKINLSAGSRDYELRPKQICCTRKYLAAYQTIRSEKDGLLSV